MDSKAGLSRLQNPVAAPFLFRELDELPAAARVVQERLMDSVEVGEVDKQVLQDPGTP